MKLNRLLVSIALTALLAACGDTGVGDPCAPQQPPAPEGQPGNPACGNASCFAATEVYIETRSLQCRSRVCMVYKWNQEGSAGESERNQRVFCTCRCGGTGDPSEETQTFCDCPDDFECETIFQSGDPGIRGAYCVRDSVTSVPLTM